MKSGVLHSEKLVLVLFKERECTSQERHLRKKTFCSFCMCVVCVLDKCVAVILYTYMNS